MLPSTVVRGIKRVEELVTWGSTRRARSDEPLEHHHHECPAGDTYGIAGYCLSCDLALEPPRSGETPAEHGWVACRGCGDLVIVCPLAEAQFDFDGETDRRRLVPA